MADRDVVPEPGATDPAGSSGDRTGPGPGAARRAGSGVRSRPVLPGGPSSLRVVRRPAVRTTPRRRAGGKATPGDELCEALENLRRVLELDPPPDRRRRAALLLVGALALAAAGVLALGLLVSGGSVPVATTASRSPAADPARTPPPPPGFPASGPGIDVPGTRLRVTVDRDGGGVDVVETLLLAAPGPGPLALAMPALAGLGPTDVTDLAVALDGTGAAVTVTTRHGVRGWTASPPDGTATRRAVLRYRISGALVTVAPAPAGRALALVTPLTAAISQAAGRPVTVDVVDSRVRGVACPGVQGGGSVCGSRTATGWTASVPAGATPVVLLQIDGG